LALWRNDDRTVHPKGSCAGCHGPDFLDLARIGTTRDDVLRRAVIDGATPDQAEALANAIEHMRTRWLMPRTDARTFRPFQPGGKVIFAGSTKPRHIAAVERDIAFGYEMERLMPTLFGPPIETLEEAEIARSEMLDILHGTDGQGHNPDGLNLRSLPVGIPFPLWSADAHHGPEDGTLNDWVADLAHDARPEEREAWQAVMDDYLSDPNRVTFWRMYAAAEEMTVAQPLRDCTFEGTNSHLACGAVDDFNRDKFLSALIGQHRMRLEVMGRPDDFQEGPLAYAYLDADPALDFMLKRKQPHFLPGNNWEVGDRARVMLKNDRDPGSLREQMDALGFPDFAVDSVDGERTATQEQHELRLAWFWLGFTQDPSFARTHASNSTKSGEYMIASLLDENLHLHNSFAANMRIVAKGTLPEANVAGFNKRVGRIERTTPVFRLNYSYFVGYNRTVLKWKEDKKAGRTVPTGLKAIQEDLWSTFTANAFRMGMHLYLADVERGALATDVPTYPLKVHFDTYAPERKEADYALLNRVRYALGEAAYE
ncbi:MAG: hypothetical protein WBF53_11340, partial [Litorimonas sp.]